jgi:outer membrane immunogenic protein
MFHNSVAFQPILHPDSSGPAGGGQVGYNLQMGNFVVGLETDVSLSGMAGDDRFPPPASHLLGSGSARVNEE